jgi:fumarate reductase subunit D
MTSRDIGLGNAENMSTFLSSDIENALLLICLVLPTQAKLHKLIGHLQRTLSTDTN